jgi:DNA-binding NarL/FixJ family response regulator
MKDEALWPKASRPNGHEGNPRKAPAPSVNKRRLAVQAKAHETNGRALRPEPRMQRAVWVECPYPLVTLGLKQTLGAAGYDICLERKGPGAAEQKQDWTPPCCVIYCPKAEDDVAGQVEHLRRLFPDAPVLVLGLGVSDLPLARAALRGGARGFLHLGMQPSEIARALSLASEGEIVFPRELTIALLNEEQPPDLLALTARQREILGLVAQGLTNADIARQLFLTEGTVKQHLRATYKMLGVGSRVQAARLLGEYERSDRTTER